MLNVSEELKQIYRKNMLPLTAEKAKMQGKIVFKELGVTIENDRIVQNTFRLTESISESGDLDFGSVNASVVEFTVADVPEDLNGKTFTITHVVNGTYTIPLGTFTVDSCKRQDDLRFKDIVAYDNMQKFNIDVADWYNSLSFPIFVQDMRKSLCDYCGVEYEDLTLVNDSTAVEKTLDTGELNGKEVLRAIAELNGAFAHINRYGKLTFITLSNFGLYPSETLYPSEDLFPSEPTELVEKKGENAIAYISSKYEDYEVSAIDGVIVQDDSESSTGIIIGEAKNPYIISDNMLIAGKSKDELKEIAEKVLGVIGEIAYIPHDTECIGLPYMEVGDVISNAVGEGRELLIARRVMTGISSIMDELSASGNAVRDNNSNVESPEIRKLKGITTKITKEVDRVGVSIKNLETATDTKFEVTDGRITAEITRAKEAEAALSVETNNVSISVKDLSDSTSTQFTNVYGAINAEEQRAKAEEAKLTVSLNGISAEVSGKIDGADARSIFLVEIGKITLGADQISLEGYTTINKGFAIDKEGNAILQDSSGNTVTMTGVGLSISDSDKSNLAGYSYDGILYSSNGKSYHAINVTENGVNLGVINRPIASAYIASMNGGTPITTSNKNEYIPTNTNQLEGDFRKGSNGTYVALSNSTGNKYLATTEWVINYVTSKLG